MKAVVMLAEVRTVETHGGNVRYVARDTDGNEYTTFREQIGKRAKQFQNCRVQVEYHEEQRGQYNNVYLDKIEPAESQAEAAGAATAGTQEAAWRTAVEAAPWLVGEPQEAVPPKELYDKLKPFEERVAEDIEEKRAAADDG